MAAPDDGVPPRFNQIYLYNPREGQPSPADVRLRHITRPFCNSRNFIYAVFVAILLFGLSGLAGAAGSPGRDILRSIDGNVLPTAPLSAELQRSFRKRPSTKADNEGESDVKAARAARAREKRRGMAEDEKAEKKAENAARMEKKRKGMAADEKAEHNSQDAARKKEERRGMSADEKAEKKAENAARMEKKRKGMAADEKAEHNSQDAARKKEERRGMSADEKAEKKAENAARMEKNRKGMSADEKAEHNAQDAARKKEERRGMSADEKAEHNAQDAARMKRCMEQEADHQDYQDPVITGMVRPGFKSAVRYTEQIFRGDLEAEPFTIGSERRPCDYCGAQLFANEIQRSGNQRDGYIYYGKGLLCCRKNKIKLPKWAMPEEGTPARDILKLWEEDSELGRFLREYSRKVMSCLSCPEPI